MDPLLSFNRQSQTAPAKERPSSNPSSRGRGTPTTNSHRLAFRGPINGLPWASGQLPLATSLLNDLSPRSLGFNSQPLTAEQRQELEDISRTKDAIRNGEVVPHSRSRIPAPSARKIGNSKKATRQRQAGAMPRSKRNRNRTPQPNETVPIQSSATKLNHDKAYIGIGSVGYGLQPGGLEADMYADIMKAVGYHYVQDYAGQREMLAADYRPLKPTQWQEPKAAKPSSSYASRPGDGPRVSYQNTLRKLNYLNVPDHSAQQEMGKPGYQPSKPTVWQNDKATSEKSPYEHHSLWAPNYTQTREYAEQQFMPGGVVRRTPSNEREFIESSLWWAYNGLSVLVPILQSSKLIKAIPEIARKLSPNVLRFEGPRSEFGNEEDPWPIVDKY